MKHSFNYRQIKKNRFTAIIEREDKMYIALSPELDVASQGKTVEAATCNLKEAVELFFECADKKEIRQRLHSELYITQFETA